MREMYNSFLQLLNGSDPSDIVRDSHGGLVLRLSSVELLAEGC